MLMSHLLTPPPLNTHIKKLCLFQVEEINIGISCKAHAYSHMVHEKLRSKGTQSSYTFIKSEVRR